MLEIIKLQFQAALSKQYMKEFLYWKHVHAGKFPFPMSQENIISYIQEDIMWTNMHIPKGKNYYRAVYCFHLSVVLYVCLYVTFVFGLLPN